jgi:putative ABC transport system ATP-binding protein
MGITGANDIEKSFFLEMLWRLREPRSGAMRLSGVDTRDLALDVLRREIAMVSSVEVINGSIRENISLHRSGVSYEDIHKAIVFVGLANVIEVLPDGINTILHPLGCILTDEELRRIMLARAIVGSPSVLVIDSLFDNTSDSVRDMIINNLFKEDNPWTLILVSDIPQILERCDQTLCLSKSDELQMRQGYSNEALVEGEV